MLYTMVYTNSQGESLTFSRETGLWITDFDLLTGLEIDVGTSQSINQVGVTVESQLVGAKTSTIKGFIQGDSTATKRRMLSVIRPMDNATITVNGEYQIDVVVASTPLLERERSFAQWEFSVTAPYPFWRKAAATVTPMSGLVGMFRFPWNITQTYTFGKRLESFFTNVTNGGQVATYFDLVMDAESTVVNPVILNVGTGDFLKLNKTLEMGERVTISIKPDSLSAESSEEGDIEGLIDIESTLFSIPPGDTILKYDADSGREALNLSIRFTDKFAGVVV